MLVNYDLPWNPMIVEQRIGRIQRLASEHARSFVYSVILRGTFEEYIVGRLMEKLQMASHAIGDMEALLDASGPGQEDDEDGESFEEEIRRLVMNRSPARTSRQRCKSGGKHRQCENGTGRTGTEHRRDAGGNGRR